MALTRFSSTIIAFWIIWSGGGCSRIFDTVSDNSTAPYPPSSIIKTIVWDQSTTISAADGINPPTGDGSDGWSTTWASDGNLYAAWGDGGGFSTSDYSWGVARIQGIPPAWSGQNLYGKSRTDPDAGKVSGLISVNGVIYLWLEKQDDWQNTRIVKSSDNGNTWTLGTYILEYPLNRFNPIQFGQDYQGARDNYIYGYLDPTVGGSNSILYLARVPKTGIEDRNAYEVFSGVNANGNPTWSATLANAKAVFTDPNGIHFGEQAVYHKVLKRYLLTVTHGYGGDAVGEGPGLGVFDAPEPWGPWTTAYYTHAWKDSYSKFGVSFPPKWMSADGTSGWMRYSGHPEYDGLYLVKYTLVLKSAADTASHPVSLTAPSNAANLYGTVPVSNFPFSLRYHLTLPKRVIWHSVLIM